MITIDGSWGEGGGQILRTALGLSLVTGKAFKIYNIRAKRQKPGLMRQHQTAVDAAREVSQARVTGAEVGSLELTFEPQAIQGGAYHFAVGTAGSATLVLQTVLPPLLLANRASHLVLEGGTHNPLAPPFDFLVESFLPCLKRMGVDISCRLERYGFYPAGGGRMTVHIEPVSSFKPLELLTRGALQKREATGLVSLIPQRIAEEEVQILLSALGWEAAAGKALTVKSAGPGNVLFVKLVYEHISEVFTGFGEKGLPLRKVAEGVLQEVKGYLETDAPVGVHLADQLLIPLALAGRGRFRTVALSDHTLTNMKIIKQFLDVEIQSVQITDKIWEITLKGDAYAMG